MNADMILTKLLMLPGIIIGLSFHEFAHAWMSDKLGDPTPRRQGRVTINPMAHIDPIGFLALLLVGFGWGKPVMYNPNRLNRFRSPRVMNIMVHLAGVTGNFILALVSGVIATLIACIANGRVASGSAASIAISTVISALSYTESFSLMLLAFNLIPVPPLDGFHVLEELLPYRVRSKEGYRKFEMFSPYAIWVLFIISRISDIDIIGLLIMYIQYPFMLAIASICNLIYMAFGLG